MTARMIEIDDERPEHPDEERGYVGQQRQSGGGEQERRRIGPDQITADRTDNAFIDRLELRPVVSLRGMTGERHFARGPDGDEVVEDGGTVRPDQPRTLHPGRSEKDDVDDKQREAK